MHLRKKIYNKFNINNKKIQLINVTVFAMTALWQLYCKVASLFINKLAIQLSSGGKSNSHVDAINRTDHGQQAFNTFTAICKNNY